MTKTLGAPFRVGYAQAAKTKATHFVYNTARATGPKEPT